MECRISYKIVKMGEIPEQVNKAHKYIEAIDKDGHLELTYAEHVNEFSADYDKCSGLSKEKIDKLTDVLRYL